MQVLHRKKSIVIGLVVLVLLAVALGVAYVLMQDKNTTTPPAATDVINLVARHFVLPTDEEPAILTVINKSEVSSAFLKGKVEDGDKVLIYQRSQKAIIYRPSLDRVIDAGPAIVDDVDQASE